MTYLFTRFDEDLQLRGMSKTTIDMYLQAVRQLTNFYQKQPELISDEELKQNFLYNKNGRKWSRIASMISLCGIKHFYTITLKRDRPSLKLVRPETVRQSSPTKEKRLPGILSRDEVWGILKKRLF